MLYWCTHPFINLLGFSVDAKYRLAVRTFIKACRPASVKGKATVPKSGFGGGPGQIMHLAPSYAAFMTLANICETKEEWADIVDRREVHDWLLSLKQPDGSFIMHDDGEVDVR